MRIIEPMLHELDAEAKSTEKVLQRVPLDRLEWRPHAKSMPLGQLASHIATLPRNMQMLLEQGSFDLTGARPALQASDAFVENFRNNQKSLRGYLEAMSDEQAREKFTLQKGDEVLHRMSKLSALRTILMNHTYHHRGQLTVYLRLLDIPVPAIYGTSADEAR